MNFMISLVLVVTISAIQTVNEFYFGAEKKPTPVSTAQNPVEKKQTKLADLKKDPLYPFIGKQNKTVEKQGQKYIKNADNLLILVNKNNSLPPGYAPKDLTRPHVPFSFGDQKLEKAQMRAEAAKALEAFLGDAKKAGNEIYAVSGYRSYKRQQQVFQAEMKANGEEAARKAVAYPGTSEHQTGLAMDVSSRSQGFNLTEAFGETKEGKWAKENAAKYGFILRYMKGKEPITQYKYESWHFRYVGKKAATIIYQKNWTLEEFFKQVASLEKKVKQAR